ncbi:MAG: DUF4243 domain-containing protein [Acidimicrobiia bacterium]|nr:DUF4243 domain-containing protein [Acidimicrobiia bacterium]
MLPASSTSAPTVTRPPSAAVQAPPDPVLHELLDAELDWSPHARGGFISHLAMSLVAARRLGASDDELRAWFDAQTTDGFLVRRNRPTWLEADTRRIRQRGVAAEAGDQLPALVDAPSSQFFHAIIRLDLAIDADHAGGVANALGNWREDADPLAAEPAGAGDAGFGEVLDRLASDPRAAAARRRPFAEIATLPWFADALDQLAGAPEVLDEVAAAAAQRHVEPSHFGTLHLVTGSRAARAVAPLLDEDDRTRLALRVAQAAAAALVEFGALAAPDDDVAVAGHRGSSPGWPAIGRAAIDSGDPHVAKVVYACTLEFSLTGHPIYEHLAARQVGTR